ncbi:enoyl-CoA hydratase/isomerase family protein [Corynebacterium heidelbergense]|uniref:Enoyl-CoA hydratase/isomerase family protein n=1 Tax=Corynebacterium heidelbergense TaxID=2055947 RepID=A0A364VAQ5_9CORY|nr:enoyl-CoA hydratase/isomerase family protein [Corynebacterium heidelbergense]RAV33688.1 enoyl-CoA hydratase/isomerase family protein [Corynebacterium heidelbergense]
MSQDHPIPAPVDHETRDARWRIAGHAGLIELDRPKALNSLNADMLAVISEALDEFEANPQVHHVVLRSTSPRAFCAGGDVRWVAEEDAQGKHEVGDEFFRVEYALNRRLGEYPKPLIALLEGVTMGGGFGISAHGSHRVITPRSLGAMPEAAIGFIPDVGMSYRLTHLRLREGEGGSSREADGAGADGADVGGHDVGGADVNGGEAVPRKSIAVGTFIGLTGWRLSPADLLYTGLATNLVADVDAVANALETREVSEVLAPDSQWALGADELDQPRSALRDNAAFIEEVFAYGDWLEMSRRLRDYEPAGEGHAGAGAGAGERHAGDNRTAEFVEQVRAAVAKGNPVSLAATVELFHASALVDLPTALDYEAVLARYLRRQRNFTEGVRAVLVDKDHAAAFDPSTAEGVDIAELRALLMS